MTRQNIEKILEKLYPALQKKFKVGKIGLFGSFVRNEQTQNSDIDILVTFLSPVGLEFFELQSFLEERLARKVDLVPSDSLKPEFRETILQEVAYIEEKKGL